MLGVWWTVLLLNTSKTASKSNHRGKASHRIEVRGKAAATYARHPVMQDASTPTSRQRAGAAVGRTPDTSRSLRRPARRRTSWRATLLIPGTKKEDYLESPFAYPGDKKEDFLEGQFAYPGDKEGVLPGGPVCLSREQRRRTARRASLLVPGTKKEDFLEGQFAFPGDEEWRASWLIPAIKKEDFLDFLEGQFACPGDKEGGLPGGPVCLSRGQRRRTSWRANLLIPGAKKEDFLEGQFVSPGDKEGGLPGGPDKEGGLCGGPICLSRGQRRRTS